MLNCIRCVVDVMQRIVYCKNGEREQARDELHLFHSSLLPGNIHAAVSVHFKETVTEQTDRCAIIHQVTQTYCLGGKSVYFVWFCNLWTGSFIRLKPFVVHLPFVQVELKFPAPSKTGNYQYSVILRSDSYMGLDQIKPLKVSVCVFGGRGCLPVKYSV